MTPTLTGTLRAAQALRLAEAQERLEKLGWTFAVQYVDSHSAFIVAPSRRSVGVRETFVRSDRADCLAQALQWATMQEDLWRSRAWDDDYDQDSRRDDTIDRYEAMRDARRDG